MVVQRIQIQGLEVKVLIVVITVDQRGNNMGRERKDQMRAAAGTPVAKKVPAGKKPASAPKAKSCKC